MAQQHYDVISDIHGDLDRMIGLLDALGYDLDNHRHPDGNVAVFLGDFIDRGSQNLAVLRRMTEMRAAGSAIAIMGNHELNMLLLHEDGPRGDGLRRRTAANLHQHESFLRECPLGSSQAQEARALVHSLPLFHDFGHFRIVHAFWSDAAVAAVRGRRPDGRIRPQDLHEISLEHKGSAFASAVALLAKGPELALPAGAFFLDGAGVRRDKCRLRWWDVGARLHDAVVAVPDLANIPNDPVPGESAGPHYSADAPPLFFGHYQLSDAPAMGGNYLCLDMPERPMAYSWRGERRILSENLIRLDGCSALSLV